MNKLNKRIISMITASFLTLGGSGCSKINKDVDTIDTNDSSSYIDVSVEEIKSVHNDLSFIINYFGKDFERKDIEGIDVSIDEINELFSKYSLGDYLNTFCVRKESEKNFVSYCFSGKDVKYDDNVKEFLFEIDSLINSKLCCDNVLELQRAYWFENFNFSSDMNKIIPDTISPWRVLFRNCNGSIDFYENKIVNYDIINSDMDIRFFANVFIENISNYNNPTYHSLIYTSNSSDCFNKLLEYDDSFNLDDIRILIRDNCVDKIDFKNINSLVYFIADESFSINLENIHGNVWFDLSSKIDCSSINLFLEENKDSIINMNVSFDGNILTYSYEFVKEEESKVLRK